MKKSAYLALILVATSTVSLDATLAKRQAIAKKTLEIPSEVPMTPTLRILLQKDVSEALVEVKGSYKVSDPRTGSTLGRGIIGKNFFAVPLPTGLKWGEEYPGIYQIAITPNLGHRVHVNGVAYKGTVLLYQIGHRLSVVNEVSVEDYLKIRLAKEVDARLPEEVLASLAIAARTDAYFHRINDQEAYWQLDADQIGYNGFDQVKVPAAIEEAVNATRFLVMQSNEDYSTKGLFPASWTAHSAGKTAAFHTIHRTDAIGPKQGVDMPFASQDRKQSEWMFSVSKEELAQLLKIPKVTKVVLYSDAFSEKVYHLRFYHGSDVVDKDFFDFQKLVGADQLQSTDFTVNLSQDAVTFVGYGKGEGTGVCLYSAMKMAEVGANAQQILGKSFPDTQLVLMPTLLLKTESLAKLQAIKTPPHH